MDNAQAWAQRSTCSRAHVGVVIAREGRVLVTGYNGAPSQMEHCDHSCDCAFPGEGGLLFSGKHLSNCATTQPCEIAVHAEANGIAWAARWGISLEGAELHTTMVPCLYCARLIINAGIGRVVSASAYRDGRGLALLEKAGIALA